jgi:hypothetical protein
VSYEVTVSCTTSGVSNGEFAVVLLEVSGMPNSSPVDVAPSVSSGHSESIALSEFSTSNADDLILIACSTSAGVANITAIGAPSGFTSVDKQDSSSSYPVGDGDYEIVSSTQSDITPAWSVTADANFYWVAAAVAYKQATGEDLDIVQVGSQATGTGSVTASLSSTPTAGNTILVIVLGYFPTSTTISVADNVSGSPNTFTSDNAGYNASGTVATVSNPGSTELEKANLSFWRAPDIALGVPPGAPTDLVVAVDATDPATVLDLSCNDQTARR